MIDFTPDHRHDPPADWDGETIAKCAGCGKWTNDPETEGWKLDDKRGEWVCPKC
jgi:hypothetical protein